MTDYRVKGVYLLCPIDLRAVNTESSMYTDRANPISKFRLHVFEELHNMKRGDDGDAKEKLWKGCI